MGRATYIGFTLAIAGALLFRAADSLAAETVEPNVERKEMLMHLLRHDCGACHGMTLRGGLGPPLDPQSLQGKPPEGLRQTILFGRPGTAMPGWQPFLSEGEAQWLVNMLMQGETQEERNTKARRHEERQTRSWNEREAY
jgi:cytochrome c55X